MRTFSQIVADNKKSGPILSDHLPQLQVTPAPQTPKEKKLAERIRGFIFKEYGSDD